MTLSELKKLITFAKKHGIESISVNGASIKFGPQAPTQLKISPDQLKEMTKSIPDMPTADDLMFWSTNEPLPSDLRQAQQEAQDKLMSS